MKISRREMLAALAAPLVIPSASTALVPTKANIVDPKPYRCGRLGVVDIGYKSTGASDIFPFIHKVGAVLPAEEPVVHIEDYFDLRVVSRNYGQVILQHADPLFFVEHMGNPDAFTSEFVRVTLGFGYCVCKIPYSIGDQTIQIEVEKSCDPYLRFHPIPYPGYMGVLSQAEDRIHRR